MDGGIRKMQSDFAGLEDYLRTCTFDQEDVFETVIGGAHGGKVKLILRGGVGVIVKPEDGTPDKALAVPREEAGWVVARDLGFTALVACTVQRTVTLGGQAMNAAVQVLWPDPTPDSAASIKDFDQDQIFEAAVFDVISNHTDHTHNFSSAPQGAANSRLRLYDNGYAFDFPGRTFASAFYEEVKGHDLPKELLSAITHFVEAAPDTSLTSLIGAAAFTSLLQRAQGLLDEKQVTHIGIPN